MGCCGQDDVRSNNGNDNNIKDNESNDTRNDPQFPDMEEWEGDRYSGVGPKRMKGYKCDLPIDQLNDKRRLFWDTKIAENKNWEIVRKICIADEERIKQYLSENKFMLKKNCLNHIIGPDGTHFYVPNYCINDPYFEKELLKEEVEEKKITLNLIEKCNNINLKEEFSNHDNGKKIKKVIREKEQFQENEYNLRLFFSGTEIKDDDLIYQHKLQDNQNIIIFLQKS